MRLFFGTPPPCCPGAIISKVSASSSWFKSSILSSSSTSSKSSPPTLEMHTKIGFSYRLVKINSINIDVVIILLLFRNRILLEYIDFQLHNPNRIICSCWKKKLSYLTFFQLISSYYSEELYASIEVRAIKNRINGIEIKTILIYLLFIIIITVIHSIIRTFEASIYRN